MKSTIGLRAHPKFVAFCVIQSKGDVIEIRLIDRVNIPKALKRPEQLKYLRNTFSDIINENNVQYACIRVTESAAQTTNVSRLYIEGVMQELIASSTIVSYYIGQIASISAKLGIERENFKTLAGGSMIFKDIESWKKYKIEERESIMAAFSALKIK